MKIELNSEATVTGAFFADARPCSHDTSIGAYQLDVLVTTTERNLGPAESVDLYIEYTWPGFLPQASEASYQQVLRVSHPFTFEYDLQIACADPGLLASPSFGIHPVESAALDNAVIQTASGAYIVRTRSVPSGTPLSVSLTGRPRGPALPLLVALAAENQSAFPFDKVAVIFIQHLLDDFGAVLDAFLTCGLRPYNTFIVGLPYSSKPDVVQDLGYRSASVQAPANYDNETFKVIVRETLNRAYSHCANRAIRFIVVEDGGYVARLFREREPDRDPDWSRLCTGIVEQTTNGIRVTQDWQTRSDEYGSSPPVPVVNVAESPLKLLGESPLIGRAIVFNIKRLLDHYAEPDLSGKRALVVGYGSIGAEVTKALLNEQCVVHVAENDAEKAKAIPEALVSADFARSVSEADLIIGCTGKGVNVPAPGVRPPFDQEAQFLAMKDGAVLINASSKRCEFNWDAIGNVTKSRRSSRGFGHERVLRNGRTIRVAADGFPVNFYNSQSAPAEKMQPILGMLFVAACRLLQNAYPGGVIGFPPEDEQHIRELYDDLIKK